ncbi:MAG: sugar ABC transporter ATP-binding protein [Synergistetes bacterium]|nr:sugar ABC transporter ATP-binding protein [Synergistota bacterium]
MRALFYAENIVKNFGGVKALKSVNIDLREGEIHALVGENGAGKSTLIKIMSGVIQPDSGRLILEDEEIKLSTPRDAHERGIATLYQEPLIYKSLTVIENIFLGNEIKTKAGSIDWRAQQKKAKELFNMLEIDSSFIGEKMGNLSVGLQQLALIAKALNFNAKIFIFDEPTAILTEIEAKRLFNIIEKLRNQGKAILYISHRLEEIFEIADRVTVFRDGNDEGTYRMEEISREKIIELMAGRTLIESIERVKNITKKPILEVENLSTKYYRGVSFLLYGGEILGFSGLIGSGRSEVMQTLFGLIKPESGRILLDGKEVKITSPKVAMDLGIAYLPKDRASEGLFLRLNIRFNISIPLIETLKGKFMKINSLEEESLAKRYMDSLQIKAPSTLTILQNLSGGNQQKVLLGKWLSTNPRILILNEPTRGVDVGVKVEIHREIIKLAENGISIILVSSELPEIVKLCDRVIVMHEGSITGRFDTKEFIVPRNLLNAATGARMIQTQ